MAEIAPPPTQTPPAITASAEDPLVKKLIDSLGKAEGPKGSPPPEPLPLTTHNVTVSELGMSELRKLKEGAPPPAPTAAPATPPPGPAAADPPKPAVKLRPKVEPPTPTPPAPPTPPPAVTQAPPPTVSISDEDRKYIREHLTPEQQDELELAEYAEAHGKPGLAALLLGYYRKVEGFIEANPDSDPDGEEFRSFVKKERPKWTEAEQRRLDRQMIADRAVAKALEQADARLKPVAQELLEIKTKPAIDLAVSRTESDLSAPAAEGEAVEPLPADVVKMIREKGYEAAEEVFTVEAPIVRGAVKATFAYEELSAGLREFNPNDPVDNWLAGFVARKCAEMMRAPEKDRTLADGRKFMPLHQYNALCQQNPAEARKHYSFTPEMMREEIVAEQRQEYTKALKKLDKAGFKRQPVATATAPGAAAPAPNPAPKNEPPTNSPRAGSSGVPGAAITEEPKNEALSILSKVLPGVPLSQLAGR